MLATRLGASRSPRRPAALLLIACAGIIAFAACHRQRFGDVVLPPFPSASGAAEAAAPPGLLWREDVDRVVEAGLGRFLQQVVIEAKLDDGAFVGWEIRDLRPPEAWTSVDLLPGDVVTSVNGLPLEREDQAFDAFQGLLKAGELRVTYLRAGETRELLFRIVARGSVAAAPASARPAAAPSASAGATARPAPPAASSTAPAK